MCSTRSKWHPLRWLSQFQPLMLVPIAAGVMLVASILFVILQSVHKAHPSSGDLFGVAVILFALGVLIFVFALVCIFARWRVYRSSPFVIAHNENGDDCVEWNDDPKDIWQQLRVKVTTSDGNALRNVRLEMVDRTPAGRKYFMHLMHDDDEGTSRSREGEDLPCGGALYFDVATHRPGISAFAIDFASRNLRGRNQVAVSGAQQFHWFTFEATGRRADEDKPVKSHRETFRLDVKSSAELSLQLAEIPKEATASGPTNAPVVNPGPVNETGAHYDVAASPSAAAASPVDPTYGPRSSLPTGRSAGSAPTTTSEDEQR